jgi:hypothetical protein
MLRAAPSSPTEAVRDQIVIAPHHQDSLRRPSPRLGAIGHDRFRQTLLWNVFRTFGLLPPAFWLRRLQARLHMHPVPGAPHTVRVDLWRALGLPPAHHIDGVRPDVVADVVIETEHAVWTLMLCGEDLRHLEAASVEGDFASKLIEATSWYAGTRSCYLGILSSLPGHQDVGVALVERYFRSRDSLQLRSDTRGNALSNVRGIGSARWSDLAATPRSRSVQIDETHRYVADPALETTKSKRQAAGRVLTQRVDSVGSSTTNHEFNRQFHHRASRDSTASRWCAGLAHFDSPSHSGHRVCT